MPKVCTTVGCDLKNIIVTRPEASFCAACGKQLDNAEECRHCKHTIYPQDKFCEFCGRPTG